MAKEGLKYGKIEGADIDPNDEFALLRKWEKEALEEIAEKKKKDKMDKEVKKTE